MSNVLYQLSPKETQSNSPQLLYASRSKYGNDWHSTLHSHPFTELFLITSGDGYFDVSGNSNPVQKNDLVIINSMVSHTEVSKKDSPLEYISLGVEGLNIITSDSNQINNEDSLIIHLNSESNPILKDMERILEELKNLDDQYYDICQNLLTIILINIKRYSKSTLIYSNEVNDFNICYTVKEYIDQNYFLDITLDTLSNVGLINKYYLSHEFKKEFGISPIKYLLKRRIEISKILLETTDHEISHIASIVGFNSQSYFNQIFKTKTGLTPGEYRNEKRIKY